MQTFREESNKLNWLNKVIEIQKLTKQVYKEDMTYKYIWRHHIKDAYFIAYNTYIRILNVKKKEQLDNLETKIHERNQQEVEMKEKTQPTLFGLLAFVICLVSACGVPANKLASTCAEQYPCKDSLVVKKVTKTDTLELWDTYVEHDTIECPPSKDGVTLIETDTVYLKGHKVIITRTVRDSTWWRIDQAHIAALALEIEGLEQQRDNLTAKLASCQTVAGENTGNLPWWWLLITTIGGFVVAKFYNKKPKK
jgi:hypothetical protein